MLQNRAVRDVDVFWFRKEVVIVSIPFVVETTVDLVFKWLKFWPTSLPVLKILSNVFLKLTQNKLILFLYCCAVVCQKIVIWQKRREGILSSKQKSLTITSAKGNLLEVGTSLQWNKTYDSKYGTQAVVAGSTAVEGKPYYNVQVTIVMIQFPEDFAWIFYWNI